MSTKERIYQEIENARPEDLEELHRVIHEFLAARNNSPKKQTLMSKLREIKIYAPEDFSENLDLYMSGEKTLARRSDPD